MPTTQTVEKSQKRQTLSGVVVSNKMKDTAVVIVERYEKHEKYGKYRSRRTKIMAHDPGNTRKVGEEVTIEACRPLSKRKAFKIIK